MLSSFLIPSRRVGAFSPSSPGRPAVGTEPLKSTVAATVNGQVYYIIGYMILGQLHRMGAIRQIVSIRPVSEWAVNQA